MLVHLAKGRALRSSSGRWSDIPTALTSRVSRLVPGCSRPSPQASRCLASSLRRSGGHPGNGSLPALPSLSPLLAPGTAALSKLRGAEREAPQPLHPSPFSGGGEQGPTWFPAHQEGAESLVETIILYVHSLLHPLSPRCGLCPSPTAVTYRPGGAT